MRKKGNDELDMAAVPDAPAGASDSAVAEKIRVDRPGRYNVIMHNDDVTPMNFVVEVLVSVFGYELNKAVQTMLEIHHRGQQVVGTYIKSIAESKVMLVREAAVKVEVPLNVTMEKE